MSFPPRGRGRGANRAPRDFLAQKAGEYSKPLYHRGHKGVLPIGAEASYQQYLVTKDKAEKAELSEHLEKRFTYVEPSYSRDSINSVEKEFENSIAYKHPSVVLNANIKPKGVEFAFTPFSIYPNNKRSELISELPTSFGTDLSSTLSIRQRGKFKFRTTMAITKVADLAGTSGSVIYDGGNTNLERLVGALSALYAGTEGEDRQAIGIVLEKYGGKETKASQRKAKKQQALSSSSFSSANDDDDQLNEAASTDILPIGCFYNCPAHNFFAQLLSLLSSVDISLVAPKGDIFLLTHQFNNKPYIEGFFQQYVQYQTTDGPEKEVLAVIAAKWTKFSLVTYASFAHESLIPRYKSRFNTTGFAYQKEAIQKRKLNKNKRGGKTSVVDLEEN